MSEYILPLNSRVPLEKNFATNVNPLGPPDEVLSYLSNHYLDIKEYPDLWHQRCDREVGSLLGIDPKKHISIPGTSQFFSLLPFLLDNRKQENLQIKWASFSPTFWEYELVSKLNNIDFLQFPLNLSQPNNEVDKDELSLFLRTNRPQVFFVCQPNNPTGHSFSKKMIADIALYFPDIFIILDLTYSLFEDSFKEFIDLCNEQIPNIICVLSYSKFFCLPGLRAGSVCFSCTDLANRFRKINGPVRINIFTERILPVLLKNETYINRSKNFFVSEWKFFTNELLNEKITWLATQNNTNSFRLFYLSFPDEKFYKYKNLVNGEVLATNLLSKHNIRVCSGKVYGINDAIRIRVGTRDSNVMLIHALKDLMIKN